MSRASEIAVPAKVEKLASEAGATLRKVSNRASREIVARVPFIRDRDLRRREERRIAHAPNIPVLSTADQELVDRLGREGAVVTSLDELALPGTDELKARLAEVGSRLEARSADGPSTFWATNDELADEAILWRWGMSERLLDIVENHLGLPARYYGGEVRCEVADTGTYTVRQWHRDVEDDRLFKILIWLNDVDDEGGPFEFVQRPRTDIATTDLSYVSGFVSDDDLAQAVPRSEWNAAVGDTWTAVIADTSTIFHRAKPPTGRNRYSATFTYSTWHPRKLYPKVPFSDSQTASIRDGLSKRQNSSLPDVIGF